MMHRPRPQRRCSRVVVAILPVLTVVVVGLVGFAPVADAATDTFVYAGCSPSRYQPGSPFEGNLKSLLTSISNAAPNGRYNSFTSGANNATGSGSPAAYGLYQCRGDLDNGDCAESYHYYESLLWIFVMLLKKAMIAQITWRGR